MELVATDFFYSTDTPLLGTFRGPEDSRQAARALDQFPPLPAALSYPALTPPSSGKFTGLFGDLRNLGNLPCPA